MTQRVQKYVRECGVCQRNKYQALAPAGLLQPMPIPQLIWEELSMDFISGLPKSNGYEVVMVVVDRLSKYAHFLALKHPYTAQSVAEIFMREIVRLHGMPKSILSDRDPVFTSNFWKELFKLQGTQLRMSSAYHPQTDGQTEVINRCLETYLRCFAGEQPRTWANWLAWAEYSYNTSVHSSTGLSPFEAVYGRKPPTLLHYTRGETLVESVATALFDRDEALKKLKSNLIRAQQLMKKYYDKRKREVEFKEGDYVFVKLRPTKQTPLPKGLHPKLSARYYGPFLVQQRIGTVAYKLQLPESTRVHPVFHVSQLRRAEGTLPTLEELPEDFLLSPEDAFLPETVLATRKKGKRGFEQWLIKWKNRLPAEATWEDAGLIKNQFPDFHLEDKVALQGGSIVRNSDITHGPTVPLGQPLNPPNTGNPQRPPVIYTYTRKRKHAP